MPRPHKLRHVSRMPAVTYFKPAGVEARKLEEINLTVDEYEALRLKDVEGFEQQDCASRMKVAQSTLQRILVSAHGKVGRAIVEGKAIRIEGGPYELCSDIDCPICAETDNS